MAPWRPESQPSVLFRFIFAQKQKGTNLKLLQNKIGGKTLTKDKATWQLKIQSLNRNADLSNVLARCKIVVCSNDVIPSECILLLNLKPQFLPRHQSD